MLVFWNGQRCHCLCLGITSRGRELRFYHHDSSLRCAYYYHSRVKLTQILLWLDWTQKLSRSRKRLRTSFTQLDWGIGLPGTEIWPLEWQLRRSKEITIGTVYTIEVNPFLKSIHEAPLQKKSQLTIQLRHRNLRNNVVN